MFEDQPIQAKPDLETSKGKGNHNIPHAPTPMTPLVRTDTQTSDLSVDFIGTEVLRANKYGIHQRQLGWGISSESIGDERPILSPLIFEEHRYHPHRFLRVECGHLEIANWQIINSEPVSVLSTNAGQPKCPCVSEVFDF